MAFMVEDKNVTKLLRQTKCC